MTMRRIWRPVLIVLLLAGITAAAFVLVPRLRGPKAEIPTARVERGRLSLRVHTSGELRPGRSAMLVAPPSSVSLQIIRLAKTGEQVKAGDAVIEFDPSEQQYNLEQSRSQLQEAEQEIVKLKSDAAVRAAEDKVALLKARFAVRGAELDVERNELVSAIDARKNLLNLEEAKRLLAELESDAEAHGATDAAALAVAEEKRNKAQLDRKTAEAAIENMRIRTPIGGIVTVKENMDAAGGIYYSGMSLPEFREGDQVRPGRFVASVLAMDRMEIGAKIGEADRGNVGAGQQVEVRMAALPGRVLSGKIKSVAGLAAREFFVGGSTRKFDVVFEVDSGDSVLYPGLTADVVIQGEEMKDVLTAPRQALFEKNSKPVLYVKEGGFFQAREISVKKVTESAVVIEGVPEGAEVALVNPERRETTGSKSTGPLSTGLPGGSR